MILDQLRQCPVIGILRGYGWEDVNWILPKYANAGFRVVEITMNSPSAPELISLARDNYGLDLLIGAGTVRRYSDLEKAMKAGATFIVSPNLDEEVVKSCVSHGIPVFPGVLTPTEIERAWHIGATAVKVFPASFGGPEYIKALKGPLNDILYIPTGGVNLEDIEAYREAGAFALGMGSPLFPKKWIQGRKEAEIDKLFTSIFEMVKDWHQPEKGN